MEMVEIDFIDGKMDGKIMSCNSLPPFIIFPVFPGFSMMKFVTDPRGDERVLILQEVYKRVANTYTYLCVESPK